MQLKKSLGQNFLKNSVIAEKITSLAYTDSTISLLEIGCGEGALTRYLQEKNFKEFHIVELDDHWAQNAKQQFCQKKNNCFVHTMSILDFNFSQLNNTQITVIGNIPYNITYSIMQLLISNCQYLHEVVIMMQEEVAQKLYKQRGRDYGPISVMTQLLFSVSLEIQVEPTNFTPQPKVMSRVIKLIPKKDIVIKNQKEFSKFLSIIFKHPRKTIKNNIKGTYLDKLLLNEEITKKRAQEFNPQDLYAMFVKEVAIHEYEGNK